MQDEYRSLTELGEIYGVTRNAMGKWLTDLGLRSGGRPTAKAFNGGYVTQRDSTNVDTYIYVWHLAKTMAALEEAGHRSTA